MFCSGCGAQIEDGASFCVNCGSKIKKNVSFDTHGTSNDAYGTNDSSTSRYNLADDSVVTALLKRARNNAIGALVFACVAFMQNIFGMISSIIAFLRMLGTDEPTQILPQVVSKQGLLLICLGAAIATIVLLSRAGKSDKVNKKLLTGAIVTNGLLSGIMALLAFYTVGSIFYYMGGFGLSPSAIPQFALQCASVMFALISLVATIKCKKEA